MTEVAPLEEMSEKVSLHEASNEHEVLKVDRKDVPLVQWSAVVLV